MRRGSPPAAPRRRRLTGGLAAAACAAAILTACSGDDGGKPTFNWYINPDGQETLAAIAEQCSTDEYDIEIQLLPTSATDQRTQLARRLAAEDSSTNLMSLDPVFVPEFANAGWLAPFEGKLAEEVVDDDVLAGPATTVEWEGEVVAAPQWANTQVLWYRKSLAEAAGLDMSKPVTWAQVIDAAASQDATVGVQADRYEAYVVWINSLIQGAGGAIVEKTEDGRDAEVTLDSPAGEAAAGVIKQLVDSGATQPGLSTSNEGSSLGAMYADDSPGEFMVNWTFAYKNYVDTVGQPGGPADEEALEDLGWARYPRTVEDEESKPPVGGIDIGVGAFTEDVELAQEAAICVTSPEAQTQLAVTDGLMPTRGSVYDSDELTEAYPEDLLALFRESIDEGGPRPQSAYYSQISSAVQSVWHSPTRVDPDSTPRESAEFLRAVLDGKALL
ncbi:extracellular solute-binding protein [Nocardioides sp. zg-579]|uniref:Extracellular solute-binding protein n=1 Tax=Nocardioides marmotae TaxID=2663857 RepID=A0A6I3IUP2_9ACTN|nr:extracellular solute-binding protein [Nocardioides marmotae]MCR6030547.1 extracellular solute-binding protein [Gordonia jinghuaiqii]MTB94183.1 extracellular solute-binding protein [Nocardioides marmotae]QKE00471.1 extracellular solute-binding protein [Nocardioides marmotae]